MRVRRPVQGAAPTHGPDRRGAGRSTWTAAISPARPAVKAISAPTVSWAWGGCLTTAARRMACLAGVQQSFARAETLPAELSGWEVGRRDDPPALPRGGGAGDGRGFAAASGDRELQIDAGKVNTREGWRDVKAAVFACRGRGEPAEASSWDGAALGEVLNYFAGRQGRLNYALRLRRGQSIGGGMIEGSIKQLVDRRLKQTGARWAVEHVGPLVELCALTNSPEWNAHWIN